MIIYRANRLVGLAYLVASIVIFCATPSNSSEYTIDLFIKDIDKDDNQIVIKVAGLSLARANAQLIVEKRRPLFCPPPTYVITTSENALILKSTIGANKESLGKSWDMIPFYMLLGLQEKYPCKNQ